MLLINVSGKMKRKVWNLGLGGMVILIGVVLVSVYVVCLVIVLGSGMMVMCIGVNVLLVVVMVGSIGVMINFDLIVMGSYVLMFMLMLFLVDVLSMIINNGSLLMFGNGMGVVNCGVVLFGVNNGNMFINVVIGVIVMLGIYNDGMVVNGNNNMFVNNGMIMIIGNNLYGMMVVWG